MRIKGTINGDSLGFEVDGVTPLEAAAFVNQLRHAQEGPLVAPVAPSVKSKKGGALRPWSETEIMQLVRAVESNISTEAPVASAVRQVNKNLARSEAAIYFATTNIYDFMTGKDPQKSLSNKIRRILARNNITLGCLNRTPVEGNTNFLGSVHRIPVRQA